MSFENKNAKEIVHKKRKEPWVPPDNCLDSLQRIFRLMESHSQRERNYIASRIKALYSKSTTSQPSKRRVKEKPRPRKSAWKAQWEQTKSFKDWKEFQTTLIQSKRKGEETSSSSPRLLELRSRAFLERDKLKERYRAPQSGESIEVSSKSSSEDSKENGGAPPTKSEGPTQNRQKDRVTRSQMSTPSKTFRSQRRAPGSKTGSTKPTGSS